MPTPYSRRVSCKTNFDFLHPSHASQGSISHLLSCTTICMSITRHPEVEKTKVGHLALVFKDLLLLPHQQHQKKEAFLVNYNENPQYVLLQLLPRKWQSASAHSCMCGLTVQKAGSTRVDFGPSQPGIDQRT